MCGLGPGSCCVAENLDNIWGNDFNEGTISEFEGNTLGECNGYDLGDMKDWTEFMTLYHSGIIFATSIGKKTLKNMWNCYKVLMRVNSTGWLWQPIADYESSAIFPNSWTTAPLKLAKIVKKFDFKNWNQKITWSNWVHISMSNSEKQINNSYLCKARAW